MGRGTWALSNTRCFEMQRVDALMPELASARLAAPILFTVLVVVQGLFQPEAAGGGAT